MKVESNEMERPGVPNKSLSDLQASVMAFLAHDAGFAQVYTINRAGFPVGRTMVAPINDDWSVDLIQRKVHRRIGHLHRNPHLEIAWIGEPAPDSVNDRPHVYDFGLLIPKAVFLRGVAVFMEDAWTVERYQRQTAIQRSKGLTKAPERSVENIKEELVGIHVQPLQVRAEGFGVGAQSFTWAVEAGLG